MGIFNFWDSARGTIPVAMPVGLVAGLTQSVAGIAQVSSAGLSPGATGVDNVIAVFSLPANAFTTAGQGIFISAFGSFANNGNNKRVKIIANPTAAVAGSTISGGTTIGDTGTYSTSALSAFSIDSSIFKYGALGSNTQICFNDGNTIAATVNTLITPQLITANESAAIIIAVTGNAGSAVADILLNAFVVQPIS